jgi:hypothetical protein
MKKNLLTTFTLTLLFLPVLAGAEMTPDQVRTDAILTQATEAQIFTACSQAAIETRDGAIGSARTAYNNAMAIALNNRKDAEKKAVALTDAGDKKEAIKDAVDAYKKAVTQAQETLTKARKEAWATFEDNTNNCRDTSKEQRDETTADKKAASTSVTLQAASVKATAQSTETESIFTKIKNFFKRSE